MRQQHLGVDRDVERRRQADPTATRSSRAGMSPAARKVRTAPKATAAMAARTPLFGVVELLPARCSVERVDLVRVELARRP